MRQTLGGDVAAAATGMLSLYASPALADTDATGTAGGSPGAVSGDIVQARWTCRSVRAETRSTWQPC